MRHKLIALALLPSFFTLSCGVSEQRQTPSQVQATQSDQRISDVAQRLGVSRETVKAAMKHPKFARLQQIVSQHCQLTCNTQALQAAIAKEFSVNASELPEIPAAQEKWVGFAVFLLTVYLVVMWVDTDSRMH